MPNWKKIVTSGSNASLNELTASSAVFNGGVNFANNNLSNVGSISAGSNLISGKVPYVQVTNGEVLKAGELEGYIPFANVNLIDRAVDTGYWRFYVPFAGNVEEIIVHPHQSATAGQLNLRIEKNGSQLSSDVQGTISATAGVDTVFSFGSNYSFSTGDFLNIHIDRVEVTRSRGFGFTIKYLIVT